MLVIVHIINKRTKAKTTYPEWSLNVNTRKEYFLFLTKIFNTLPNEGYNFEINMIDVEKGREDRYFYSLRELGTFIEGIFFTISFGKGLK